jgi:Dna[CI] antecedent, DciA
MDLIGAGIDRVVAASVQHAPASSRPLLAWPLACGAMVAARTVALDFGDGVLRVEVPDAGWRLELQSLAPRYLAVINRYTADGVQRIEFVIAARKTDLARSA